LDFTWPYGADFKSDFVPDAVTILRDGELKNIRRHWFHVQGTDEAGKPYLIIAANEEPATFAHYRDAAAFRDCLPREMDPKVLKIVVKFTASVIGPYEFDGVKMEKVGSL